MDERSPALAEPLVTSVITTYNRSEPARRAIRSALDQTYPYQQIIVVEDGSDSGIAAWLESEQLMQAVTYVRHDANRGLSAARNTGLSLAAGEYVAYLDDDDEWLPQKTARQVALMATCPPDTGIVYCGAVVKTSAGKVVGHNRPKIEGDIRQAIIDRGLTTVPSASLFRKTTLEAVGGHDEALRSNVDHDIWFRLADGGFGAAAIDEPLVVAHEHSRARMTTDVGTRIHAVEAFLENWYPALRSWFGESRARQFQVEYCTKVIGRLGAECLSRGSLRKSWQCYHAVLNYGSASEVSPGILLRVTAQTLVSRSYLYHVMYRASRRYRPRE